MNIIYLVWEQSTDIVEPTRQLIGLFDDIHKAHNAQKKLEAGESVESPLFWFYIEERKLNEVLL